MTYETLRKLVTRADLGTFLTEHGLTGVGVEVGVFEGRYSEEILQRWPGHLHMVDPWQTLPEEEYCDGAGRVDMQACYEATLNRLAEFAGRVTFHRARSLEVVDQFEDESLDFAYLDGNHSYLAVKADFEAWSPKVKSGGIIGLHDCYHRDDALAKCGVWDFLWQWSQSTGIQFHLTNCTSAWIIK